MEDKLKNLLQELEVFMLVLVMYLCESHKNRKSNVFGETVKQHHYYSVSKLTMKFV